MTTERLPEWKRCWREGFAPLLSLEGLEALAVALRADDPALVQDHTVLPETVERGEGGTLQRLDLPIEAACPVAYTGWKGDGLRTVLEAEEYFGRMCAAVDQRLGGGAACRWLVNWVDDTPRERMIAQLLPEVEEEIRRRREAQQR